MWTTVIYVTHDQTEEMTFGRRQDGGRRAAGPEVVLGVRPEDLKLAGGAAAEATTGAAGAIAARVDVLEPMRTEIYAYLSVTGHTFAPGLEARAPVKEGDRLRLVAEADRLHVFDPETEKAMAGGRARRIRDKCGDSVL